MSLPLVFTSPVVLEAALTLALSIDVHSTFGTRTLDDGDVAYPTVGPGTYQFFTFLAKVAALVRAWILAAAVADADIVAPAAGFKIKLPDPLSPTRNGNKLSFTLDTAGWTVGGQPVTTIDDFQILNDQGLGPVYWGTLLGWGNQGNASFGTLAAAPTLEFQAPSQCRFLHVFERSHFDTGDQERATVRTKQLRSGKVRQHALGDDPVDREISLSLIDGDLLGAPQVLGVIASVGSRRTLVMQLTDENGLTGVSDVWQSPDLFATGWYVRIANLPYVARLTSVTTVSGDVTQVVLSEDVPDDVDLSDVAGRTLYRVSEHEAWMQQLLNDGFFYVHDPDEATGKPRFHGQAYSLLMDGEELISPTRFDEFSDLYDLTIPLARHEIAETTLV